MTRARAAWVILLVIGASLCARAHGPSMAGLLGSYTLGVQATPAPVSPQPAHPGAGRNPRTLAPRVNALVAPAVAYGFTGAIDAYPGALTIPERFDKVNAKLGGAHHRHRAQMESGRSVSPPSS